MSDEDYGQFTMIDITHDIFKLREHRLHIQDNLIKKLDYYNEHYHIDNNEYASNNTLTTINSNMYSDDLEQDIKLNAYQLTKSWVIYFGILFTSAWSIYLIFTI